MGVCVVFVSGVLRSVCFALLTLLQTYFLCCWLSGLRGLKEMKSDLGSDLTVSLSILMGKMGTLKKP